MLVITCPVCGVEGEEGDFHYGGQAHIRRPSSHDPENISDAEQRDYLFLRNNPKGLHFERWRCDRGCGKWFHAARDTLTLEFKATYGITEQPPPELRVQRNPSPWGEDSVPSGTPVRGLGLSGESRIPSSGPLGHLLPEEKEP